MGKLDEISVAIGTLQSEVRALGRNIGENRRLADGRHEENKSRLDKIVTEMAPVAKVIDDVAGIKPQVIELMEFKQHWVSILTVAAAIISGALTLIWQMIINFGDIKSFFKNLLH